MGMVDSSRILVTVASILAIQKVFLGCGGDVCPPLSLMAFGNSGKGRVGVDVLSDADVTEKICENATKDATNAAKSFGCEEEDGKTTWLDAISGCWSWQNVSLTKTLTCEITVAGGKISGSNCRCSYAKICTATANMTYSWADKDTSWSNPYVKDGWQISG